MQAECIHVKPLTLAFHACFSAPHGDQQEKHPFFASKESCKRVLVEADIVSIHKLLTIFSPPDVDLEKARDGKTHSGGSEAELIWSVWSTD